MKSDCQSSSFHTNDRASLQVLRSSRLDLPKCWPPCLQTLRPPREAIAFKLKRLLLEGATMREMVAGVRLMMECSWTALVTEQQQASVSMVGRWHPDYELETLVLRAGLHSVRRVLPTFSNEDNDAKRLKEKLGLVGNKQHQRVTARHR